VHLLLQEHRRKPISGDFLFIGRQTVPFDENKAAEYLRVNKVPARTVEIQKDVKTRARKPNSITDTTFVNMFCDARVRALDVSDYEGAEVIHDMNLPLPSNLFGVADFVFDGSCMDNIFNPVLALQNMVKLVRPGGRLFMFEHGTVIMGAYVAFHPAWFKDY